MKISTEKDERLKSSDGSKLLQLGLVNLSLDPWALLKGRLVFSQIQFVDPRLFLKEQNGKWRLPRFV